MEWSWLHHPSEKTKHSAMLGLKGLRTCPQYMWDQWKEKGWSEDSSNKCMHNWISFGTLSWHHWNRMKEKHNHTKKRCCTLVNERVGNDTPKKNPSTTPTKVVIISLIVSFGFLIIPLQPKRGPCYTYWCHFHCHQNITNLQSIQLREEEWENNTFSQQKNSS